MGHIDPPVVVGLTKVENYAMNSKGQKRLNTKHFTNLKDPIFNDNIDVEDIAHTPSAQETAILMELMELFMFVRQCFSIHYAPLARQSGQSFPKGMKMESLNQNNVEERGKKPSLKEEVIGHIKLFPVRDSHYCRSETNIRWLHEDLDIPKMYGV